MKRYINLTIKLLISLSLFATFVAFTEKPTAEKSKAQNQEIVARDRHGRGRGHSRSRHGRHGGGFQFRIDIGAPRDRYYYDRSYSEYVRVNCEVYDTKYAKVKEIQLGGRAIYLNGAGDGRRYYFTLRPGYHTIKWRVENDDYFGAKYRNYSRNFRVYRDREQVYITIKGSSISIR
ncbi:MAG: hypothetical protein KR126chlam4_00850 [Candidatus Anoxychlamydiales bacterium]|uniref:Uncharacterized protein n=1 Tax=marine sediment metagenome TaxID=412755 RepID=A0A0F8ZGP2_9ZZZZ|nr:hypothetical protein [Candidatus Anoxychlamydiales bacterium]HEU64571.1 hypothetical protein [Chlamydiota bacterium]